MEHRDESEDEYEDDYEDETFEQPALNNSGARRDDGNRSSPKKDVAQEIHEYYDEDSPNSGDGDGAMGASDPEVVSLEEYMTRLETKQKQGGNADDDTEEDAKEIMAAITRGLDGVSPPSGHRGMKDRNRVPRRLTSPIETHTPSANKNVDGRTNSSSRKKRESDDDDAILKKFNIQLTPTKNDDDDVCLNI